MYQFNISSLKTIWKDDIREKKERSVTEENKKLQISLQLNVILPVVIARAVANHIFMATIILRTELKVTREHSKVFKRAENYYFRVNVQLHCYGIDGNLQSVIDWHDGGHVTFKSIRLWSKTLFSNFTCCVTQYLK